MKTKRRQPRGSVIILVVAMLALLAVIGTIYVVGARTEKNSSSAMNVTLNLNLARTAIMNSAVEIMGQRMYGADGNLASDVTAGTYGSLPSNLYDAPDSNTPWLVATLHNQGNGNVNTYSTLTTQAFDPSAGTYSLGLTPFTYNVAIGGLTTVVGDQTTPAVDGTSDDPPVASATAADAYMYLLPFSDSTGIRYRYGLRILDTNRMANLNVGSCLDAAATGDTTGIYVTAMRLSPAAKTFPTPDAYFNNADIETNLQATLPANSGEGRAGNSTSNGSFSLSSWQQQMLCYEKPTDTALAFFDLSDELELRAYGEYGTPYHIRPALTSGSPTKNLIWPNTLSANPGSPTSGWTTGNAARRNYTTYSWDRDLRPYADPPRAEIYTITVDDTGGVPSGYTPAARWPMSPARISMNPQTPTSQGNDAIFYSVMAASNIATLMEFSTGATNSDGSANANWTDGSVSFTHEETCAFVANYLTSKWNGFVIDPSVTSPPPGGAYFLPAGPSLVDGQGICFRTATGNTLASAVHREFGNGSTDLHAENANKVYLGYSAQPFISEVAAYEANDDTGDGSGAPPHTVVTDTAVELYNPYPVALSLTGYVLKSSDGIQSIALDGQYVPANGYLVIESSGTHFDPHGNSNGPIPVGAVKFVAPSLAVSPNGGGYTLYRTYYNRSFTAALAPVDHVADYGPLTDVNGTPPLPKLSVAGTTPQFFSISRPGGSATGQWSPTVALGSYVRSNPNASTLGFDNGGTVTSGWPLPDRYASVTPGTQGANFGMGEFARIIRLANEFDGSNATGTILVPGGTNGGLVADHLETMATAIPPLPAPYNNMTAALQIDAQILFDFYADPRIYSVTPSSDSAIPTGHRHDIRATRLLEQLALLDRVSEFNIDIGNGVNDINKIRLPGRININTASGDVLRAIPNMTNQMVANILGYRNRSTTGTYAYGAGSTEGVKTSQYNFSDSATFTGHGFRSRAEILVALTDPSSTATIETRDLPWGPICCLSTVRSDTFVVYGYMEAIKAFPGGTHNNGSDWYGTVTDSLQSPATNLRVAKRRWVAIVDRSFCNYSKVHPQYQADGTADPKAGQVDTRFALPRIVAIKDLPQ